MLSNKLTFSLASLIVIFALAFATTSVMAAAGGPTVMITDAGTTAAPSTRAAFKLKFTFSQGVSGFDEATGDANFQFLDRFNTPVGDPVDINLSTGVTVTPNGRDHSVTTDLGTVPAGAIAFVVRVIEDAATGQSGGNVANSQRFPLPAQHVGKVIIRATKDTADTNTADGQMYSLTITFKGLGSTAPTPALAANLFEVTPPYNLQIAEPTEPGTAAADFIYDSSFNLPVGVERVSIGLKSTYVAAADVTPAIIPLPKMASDKPTVDISLVEGSLDTTAKTFGVKYAFTKASTTSAAEVMFAQSNVKVYTDAAQKMPASVAVTEFTPLLDGMTWVVTIDYGIGGDALPLYVSTDASVEGTPTPLMVQQEQDTTAPTVRDDAPTAAISGATTVTLTFSEAVTGVTVTGMPTQAAGKYAVAVAGTGMTREVTITPTPAADLTANVDETVVTFTVTGMDAANNPVAANTTFMVTLAARTAPSNGGNGGNGGGNGMTYDGPATASADGLSVSFSLTATDLASGRFIVIGNDPEAAELTNNATYSLININAGVIDLEDFFKFGGGTIQLIGPATSAAKDVVISEIMWASDVKFNQGHASRTASQWIELYVTGATAKAGSWMLKLTQGAAAPAAVTGMAVVDTMSNYGLGEGKWDATAGNHGQNGRTRTEATANRAAIPSVTFVSMYRDINYGDVEAGKLGGVPDGTVSAKWKATADRSGYQSKDRFASPGAKHVTGIITVADKTTVPYSPVLINEIGNNTDNANDWIELRAIADVNLKKYELAVITADGTSTKETTLVAFPDKDLKLEAGDILLIVNKDPKDTLLAVGKKFGDADGATAVADQEHRGFNESMYYDAKGGLDAMPEDGKFLLVLRTEKKDNHEKIVDLTGTLFQSDTSIRTQIRPLRVASKGNDNEGHGDVVKGADEDFRAPFVYKRINASRGTGKETWERHGFTGVGYDRKAPNNAAHGGTPGYDNGALKEKFADLSTGSEITISEIMFDTGTTRRKLPQWIELYNSSMTQGVNLNGWKLEIQNYNSTDVDARLNGVITLKAMMLPPNQTVLIVSSNGLNSGADVFPETRLVNLWGDKDHRSALEMTTRNDQILSGTGFYLKLTDKDGKLVDAVGNLDGNKKTQDEPTWALPVSDEEERRSSILRRYETGLGAEGGMSEAGWVAASMTEFAHTISHTFYGARDDLSTPGFRGGGPLPVSLSSFRPVRDKATGAVVVRWITQSELNNAGFNILRSETKTGEFKVVNVKGIIPGHGTTSEKHVYTWTDTSAKPNVVYYYQIEDVSLDGDRTTLATTHLRGNVNAAGKLTTRWSELKTYGK